MMFRLEYAIAFGHTTFGSCLWVSTATATADAITGVFVFGSQWKFQSALLKLELTWTQLSDRMMYFILNFDTVNGRTFFGWASCNLFLGTNVHRLTANNRKKNSILSSSALIIRLFLLVLFLFQFCFLSGHCLFSLRSIRYKNKSTSFRYFDCQTFRIYPQGSFTFTC